MSERKSNTARARFFIRVAQAGSQWRDEYTLPIFPLLLVMDAEMLEADARYEKERGLTHANARVRSSFEEGVAAGKDAAR